MVGAAVAVGPSGVGAGSSAGSGPGVAAGLSSEASSDGASTETERAASPREAGREGLGFPLARLALATFGLRKTGRLAGVAGSSCGWGGEGAGEAPPKPPWPPGEPPSVPTPEISCNASGSREAPWGDGPEGRGGAWRASGPLRPGEGKKSCQDVKK